MTAQTWIVHIGLERCQELLAASSLGRLGVIVDARPEIYPVNHTYDSEAGHVVFPTNVGTKLHAALHWPWVAYEIDGAEQDGGWSVLVVGRAEEINDPQDIARIAPQRQVLWRAGPSVRWIRIVPTKTTGRQISAVTQPGRE